MKTNTELFFTSPIKNITVAKLCALNIEMYELTAQCIHGVLLRGDVITRNVLEIEVLT